MTRRVTPAGVSVTITDHNMSGTWEQFGRSIMSGEARGVGASLLRAALRAAEPAYAVLMRLRNACYDRAVFHVARLPRPVVSIGNVTTGGTGKTPVVRWLATHLRDVGMHPAILLRGYKRAGATISDEQVMLNEQLNGGSGAAILVQANPSRIDAARQVLDRHPDVGVFVLDDGFQHRRVARDFDLVLINALDPFGYGHVLPRGLLREPLKGLARAHAILITHASEAAPEALAQIEQTIRRHNAAPIYLADHTPSGLRTCSAGQEQLHPLEALRSRRCLMFCGIGSPKGFQGPSESLGATVVRCRRFSDHHDYSAADVLELAREAHAAGAELLLTTEKDWAKLRALPAIRECDLPIWRLDIAIQFQQEDEAALLSQIHKTLTL